MKKLSEVKNWLDQFVQPFGKSSKSVAALRFDVAQKLMRGLKAFVLLFLMMVLQLQSFPAQTSEVPAANRQPPAMIETYLDQSNGKTPDELVAYAIANNDELTAARLETEASEALIKQADLRANPMIEIGAAKNPSTPSKRLMIRGSLPLELFGRRGARVDVAEHQAEVRRRDLANRERILAAEVRSKFGEALALVLKLQFIEETLAVTHQNYELVSARVEEGKNAPLDQNMESVELNRIRAMREISEGNVEMAMLELKNMIGLAPEEPLRLRGGFTELLDPLPPQTIATGLALERRPDLQTARAMENLAEARIDQARINGKADAAVNAGYERMRQGFPQRGFDDAGQLTPITELANVFSVGVTINLPVFDRNQGTIEAGVLEKTAAARRVEFGELTVRREVAAAYARYLRAARAMEIYRVAVEKQAEINLGVIRQTYEFGKRNLLDYIAEQRRYIDIKDGLIEAQLETYLARVEILRAISAPELLTK